MARVYLTELRIECNGKRGFIIIYGGVGEVRLEIDGEECRVSKELERYARG